MKGDLMKEIKSLLILNSPPQEEDKENKRIESQSHMENILTHLENKRIESQTLDHSSLQDPHHCGFNLGPRNYFIPKMI
jgi:hypothetical protein